MGSLPDNGKQPPTAPRSHLQSIVPPSSLVPPTGPHSAGLSPVKSAATVGTASLNLQGGIGDSSSDSPATLPLRPRPIRWRVLCKNTVPGDQSYPPPSSHTTVPQLCFRGSNCLFGHHGDLYTDAPEAGGLKFEYGIPCIQDTPGRGFHCTERTPDHDNRQIPFAIEPNVNRNIHTRPVEPWVERRAEWRKRQAALGPHADTTLNPTRWEENYKSKDVKRRQSEIGKRTLQRDDRHIFAETAEDNKRGYSSQRAQDTVHNGNHWQWGLGHQDVSHEQEKQDPVAFENGLRRLSIDSRQEQQSEAASRAEESQSKTKSETAEDDGDSTSSGETSSTVQFIIPAFQKGIKKSQNTPAPSPAKNNGKPALYMCNAIPSSTIGASTSGFRPTYMPNIQPPQPHRVEHAQVPPLARQLSKEIFPLQSALPSAPTPPKRNQSFNPPHTTGQWDMYRQNHTNGGQRSQQQAPVWMTLENLKHCMEQGQQRAPSSVEWKPYAANVRHADCGQWQTVPAPRQVQTPVNTFIVQSPSHTPSQSAPPPPTQNHLNHAWNQVKMLLSLYPDCLNKGQAVQTLHDLIVPYNTDDLDMRNTGSTPESLQTSLHRLALSISEQEHELAAEFQAEIWAVLGWLGGGGGNVALLKKMEENRMESRGGLGRELNPGKDGNGDMKYGGIIFSSGQITLHGADEKGQGYNEVVALTPGQPAILSPILPPHIPIKPLERDTPTVLLSGPSILSVKSNSITGSEEAGFYKQAPQSLSTSENKAFVPIRPPASISSLPGRAEEPYTKDVIDFFLNKKMEAYLQDSYDKVLRVQTAISLKWRRVGKVFEREWCSGISRFARNGLVLRAFRNVRAMEERDWLSHEHFVECMDTEQRLEGGSELSRSSQESESTESSGTEKPSTIQGNPMHSPFMGIRDSFASNVSTEWEGTSESTHKGFKKEFDKNSQHLEGETGTSKQTQAAWGSMPRIPQRAVWDRRGLCQEVEPVALSNEGRHFLELVEKMCLKKVVEYTDINQVGKSYEYLQKLPVPPDARFFKGRDYRASLTATMGNMVPNHVPVSEKGKFTHSYESAENWEQYKLTDNNRAWIPEEKKRRYPTAESKLSRGPQESGAREESTTGRTMPHESSEEDIQSLILRFDLVPRLIESPVLNSIFRKSGPLYYTGMPSSNNALNGGIEGRVRAKFLEMCHLDRSLFMGYIVLEILTIWEEQRKEATRVRWRFPGVDREVWVAQRLKRVEEERAMLLALKEKMALQDKVPENVPVIPLAPNWADIARGKFRAGEKKPLTASPMASQAVAGQKEGRTLAASTQSSHSKIPSRENLPSATFLVTKASSTNPAKQADNPSTTRKQTDITTMAQPNLPTTETPKPLTTGSGLLYTEVVKGKTCHKLDQASSQAPEMFQSINAPKPVPPVPTITVPPVEAAKSTNELDTSTNFDDSSVWKKYKPKKEKKRHGFDLDDSIEYQKGEIVKISPSAVIASSSIPKGHQKHEFTPSGNPPLGLITTPLTHHLTEKRENPQVEATPVQLSPPTKPPKPPALRELELEIDREIEAQKQYIRVWLNRLQTWLWTFNEGVGVNFVEISDILDWESGLHEASTMGDEGASDNPAVESMRKPHTHRGGVKNRHVLWKKEMAEREMREWEMRECEMKERERGMREWAMREQEMREREVREREMREREMREREIREREMREREMREREMREREMREREIRRRGVREQEMRRREMRELEKRERRDNEAAGWVWEVERGRPGWAGDSWGY